MKPTLFSCISDLSNFARLCQSNFEPALGTAFPGALRTLFIAFLGMFVSVAAAQELDAEQVNRSQNRKLTVVATIKPLQLIAQAIVGNRGRAEALLPSNQSPHHFSLSPRDRLHLDNAELIVWIGPQLEHFLEPVINQSASTGRIIQVTALDDLILLPMTTEDAGIDPHVWMSTKNAIHIAQEIAAQLVALDTENTVNYEANLDQFLLSINSLNQDIEIALQKFKNSNTLYAVYHNAYQYYEQEFGLSNRLALTHDPEQDLSIREIVQKRREIIDLKPSCVLLDIEADDALVDTLFSRLIDAEQPRRIQVDIMGSDIDNALTNGYRKMIERFTESFNTCIE